MCISYDDGCFGRTVKAIIEVFGKKKEKPVERQIASGLVDPESLVKPSSLQGLAASDSSLITGVHPVRRPCELAGRVGPLVPRIDT